MPTRSGQRAAQVEARPVGVDEVGGAPGAQHAVGAGRSGRVEPDRDDVFRPEARCRDGDAEPVNDLSQADFGTFHGARRVLAQAFDEKLPVEVHERVVDGGATEIDASHDRHDYFAAFFGLIMMCAVGVPGNISQGPPSTGPSGSPVVSGVANGV